MINIIKELTESLETLNLSDNKEQLFAEEYNDLYRKLVENINSKYGAAIDKINECLVLIRSEKDTIDVNGKFTIHAQTAYPQPSKFDPASIQNIVSVLKKMETPCLKEPMKNINILTGSSIVDIAKTTLGDTVEIDLDKEKISQLCMSIIYALDITKDRLENIRDILIGQLSECDTEALFASIDKLSIAILEYEQGHAYALMISFMELCSAKSKNSPMIESISNEDISTYISELKELIPKCRDFFDKFKYKEIITPRRKTIPKMTEYMRGALERKYTLKIPIYKVIDASPDAKKIIEERFIKGLDQIIDKYPNYILMTPDFKDDSDMFIYITLKEPFGDKGDRKDRIKQSEDDNAVITESSILSEDVLGTALAASTISILGLNVWAFIKACKYFKEQKKLNDEINKQNKEMEKRFELQKKKLTLMKDFDFKYISNLRKVISNAKFVKCKKNILDIANKIHDINTKYNKDILDNVNGSSAENNEAFNILKEYKEKIDKLTKTVSDEWIDSNNNTKLGTIFELIYKDYSDMYETCLNIGIDPETYSIDIWKAWRVVSESIKVQLEGDVLNESALTARERDALPDDIFGLPGRRFPLNDKEHILAAISRMYTVKSTEEKQLLAKNIEKQIVKQKLTGEITVSKDNPNKKYFSRIIEENVDDSTLNQLTSMILSECQNDKSKTLEFYI